MNTGRALVGSVLVAVGAVFMLDAAGSIEAGSTLAKWWPMAVIALGVFQWVDRGRFTPLTGFVVLAGAALLAVSTGSLGSGAWHYVWPVALIVAGVWLVLGWGRRWLGSVPDVDTVDGIAVLSAARVATRSDRFRHASLTAFLGGVTLDLSGAEPAPTGAVIDATSVLGGITVLVPRGWLVDVRGIPILGAWDDTTDRSSAGSGAPRLEVRALVVLGGLEIKHAGRWSS